MKQLDELRDLLWQHNASGHRPTLKETEELWRLAETARREVSAIADDYMTSDKHHPGYVLIPTAKFEQLRAAGVTA